MVPKDHAPPPTRVWVCARARTCVVEGERGCLSRCPWSLVSCKAGQLGTVIGSKEVELLPEKEGRGGTNWEARVESKHLQV